MTRIVFWNIDKFKETRVNDPVSAPPPGGTVNRDQMANDRRDLILRTWSEADPDIIVVVEVSAGKYKGGRLAQDTGGVSGGVYLLNLLRTGGLPISSPTWRLVPPLWIAGSGDTGLETALVFYRGERALTSGATLKRYFTGPNIWTGAFNGQSRRPGAGTPKEYAGLYHSSININAMLVPPTTTARTIPDRSQHNPTLAEDKVAARFDFASTTSSSGGGITKVDYGVAVPPLMCTFYEFDGTNERDLTLFVVHAPANPTGGDKFLSDMALTTEVVAALGPRETRVVGGDFNLNLLDPSFNMTTRYTPLTSAGYTVLLRPAGTAPTDTSAYKGYFGTHINDVASVAVTDLPARRFLWSESDTQLSYYPGYNYFSQDFYSLDNILVNPVGTHDYRTTILNFVPGTPLNKVATPPGTPPEGSVPLATGITATNWPPHPTAPVYDEPTALSLVGWNNYGRMYSISDHLPIFADV